METDQRLVGCGGTPRGTWQMLMVTDQHHRERCRMPGSNFGCLTNRKRPDRRHRSDLFMPPIFSLYSFMTLWNGTSIFLALRDWLERCIRRQERNNLFILPTHGKDLVVGVVLILESRNCLFVHLL